MYSVKDICIIIPTYNRAEDLRVTLESIKPYIARLGEIIIVDQSTDDLTKKLVGSLRKKNITYVRSDVPALTVARNRGVKAASRSSKLILFIDDDVSLDKGYFDEIVRVFNEHPNALGVGGYYLAPGMCEGRFERAIRRLFLIEHHARNSARVLSAYGAVYPSELDSIIAAQWIPGFNMTFKREIFSKMKFDEKLRRYSLAEDFDFTYRVHSLSPGSLYLTPLAKLVHRVSSVERYPAKRISYMNQAHHFYLNYKNFNKNAKEAVIFLWAIFGITFLRIALYLIKPSMRNRLKLYYYFTSLVYCMGHLSDVKKGIFYIPD